MNHASLDDWGPYVCWLFDNQERTNSVDLEVAIAPITYIELAAAFEKAAGYKAQYLDTNLEERMQMVGRGEIVVSGIAFSRET